MANLDVDAIIIGSGSGGLTAASALSQSGLNVLVLEQHYVPGGWCHSFSLEGFRFCPGVHYVGRLGEDQETRQIYEGLGVSDDLIFFEQNPEGFEHCLINGTKFDYPNSLEIMTERLVRQFPHERQGLQDYMHVLRWLVHELPLLFEIKTLKDMILMPYRTRHIGKYGLFSLDRILKARINDPVIRGILSVQCGDYGQPPSKTMMLLHAGLARHYEFGGYYPRGGGSAIARALVKTIRQSGGQIKLSARVEKILVEKNGKNRRALGVRLSNGDEYRTKNIISNADPHTTFYGMVGEENLSSQLKKRLAKVTYSLSSLTLFLAVAFDPADFGIDSGNLWYASDADFDKIFNEILSPRLYEKDQFSGIFVSSPSKKDPTSYTGRAHTLEVVTFVGYGVFRQFEDSVTEHRPKAYKELKEKIKKMFFKTLDNIIPNFATHVVFCALGTPLTNRHYMNTTEGCIYGIEKSYRQIGPMSFRTHTEIEGLQLVGASTLSHGVSGTAVSGLNAARAILECERAELLVHKKQDLQVYSAEDRSQWPDWLKQRCREPQRSRLSSGD